jgi:hypothetical protein
MTKAFDNRVLIEANAIVTVYDTATPHIKVQ